MIFIEARKGKIEALRWNEVDFDAGYLKLADLNTGQKALPLKSGALQILAETPQFEVSPFVFPAHRGDGYYEGTPKVWRTIRETAGIEDVRHHDLRHSFASAAVSGGATTQRYVHLDDNPFKAATESKGRKLVTSLSEPSDSDIQQLGKRHIKSLNIKGVNSANFITEANFC